MLSSARRLSLGRLSGLVLLLSWSGPAIGAAQTDDARAVEIARRALDAVRTGWSLAAYDQAGRVRASINLRGAGAQGLTANVVIDRATPRWRLDAAGGVGPLTLWAMPDGVALHVPSLSQHAKRPGGNLARMAGEASRLDAQVAAMRSRLEAGYTELSLAGEETLAGAATWRLDDRVEPGTTASYWIDQRSHLPRRIVLDRPGRRDMRVELSYGSSPRPTGATVYLQGQRDVELRLTPTYDGSGRVSRVQIVTRPSGSSPVTTDVTIDWSPAIAAGFFRFTPPAGSTEVPFGQLSQGVLLMAAGALGGLLPIVLGAS